MSKKFHIGDILSVTIDKLVSKDGIDGVYNILNYMTGESLMTHQLPRVSKECALSLILQHPMLQVIDGSEVNESNWEEWVDEMARLFGEYFDVKTLHERYHIMQPCHKYVHPLDEDILKGKKIIVLDTSEVE